LLPTTSAISISGISIEPILNLSNHANDRYGDFLTRDRLNFADDGGIAALEK
jgi:hypothetical protein